VFEVGINTLGDAERVSWDYSVGGKSTAGPFLAVDAVAEGSDIRFTYIC
jgi:hypothetical protein